MKTKNRSPSICKNTLRYFGYEVKQEPLHQDKDATAQFLFSKISFSGVDFFNFRAMLIILPKNGNLSILHSVDFVLQKF